MQTLLSILLALILLLFPSIPQEQIAAANANSPAAPQEASNEASETLWGRSIAPAATEELPEEAFTGEYIVPVLLAHDGQSLLICGGPEPYLWNGETGAKTPLYLGDQRSCDAVREMILQAQANIASRTGVTEAPLDPDALPDEELLQTYLASSRAMNGQCLLFRAYDGYNALGPYAHLYDTQGGSWILNDETGALYTRATGTVDSVYEDQLLVLQPRPEARITIEKADGTQQTIALDGGFAGGTAMTAATFLPDGSVCAVVRDQKLDKNIGQECAVVIRHPDGKTEKHPLGKLKFGTEPDTIVSADARHVVVFNRTRVLQTHPFLIDRDDGAVSMLYTDGRRIAARPLAESLDGATGAVIQPQEASLYVVSPLSDGETLLAYTFDNSALMLWRPASMLSSFLFGSADRSSAPVPVSLTGNGYDRWLYWSTRALQLVTLQVK